LKNNLIYMALLGIKSFSAIFYRFNVSWIGDVPSDPWSNLRIVLLLNHTSLYEPIFAGFLPNRFLKNIAQNGLIPVADKTFGRPLVGRFYRIVAQNVVPITRERDKTWENFLKKIHSRSLVIMAPEGRMKRANGLDADGKPMTVRGGIADLIQAVPGGRMLIGYSGGLHHVQAPNQLVPKLFKTLRMKIESVDIAQYRDRILCLSGQSKFKHGIISDLEERRGTYCES
jgi:hypothetical protein